MSYQEKLRDHPTFCVLLGNLVLNNANSDIRDEAGNTSLHLAVIGLKDTDIIKILLDNGADIHARNHENHTPLDIAIQEGKTEAALLLIKREALVNPSMNLFIHLKTAISQINPKMIEAILPHCGFSTPSDLYIPKKLVVNSNPQCKDCVKLLEEWNFSIHPDSHHDVDFICKAVEKGFLSVVDQLLEHGIDVNMVDPKTGLNLLTIACFNKHHQVAGKLLEYNADVNVKISGNNGKLNNDYDFYNNVREFGKLFSLNNRKKNPIDVTCLHIAVLNSDWMTTEILLKYIPKEPNVEFVNLTCYAIVLNCEQIVRAFLEHCVKVTDVNLRRKKLWDFCLDFDSQKKNDRYHIFKVLLENGADMYLKTPGNLLVSEAMKNGHRKIAQLYLDYNADVQYISPNGHTLLHKAITNGFDAKFIKTLLERNLPINTADCYGSSPLLDACRNKSDYQLEIIEALLHYDADVNYTDHHLRTPLHCASFGENLQIVQLLLNKGADLHAMDKEGQTPLHYACKHKSDKTVSIIGLFLEHGANIEVVDNRGRTPLLTACKEDNYLAVEFLLDHRANPNHTDRKRSTSLHIAVQEASFGITKILIKYGANINSLDENNQTALQFAIQSYRDYHRLKTKIDSEKNIKILKTQVVKLVVAGFEVNDENRKIVYDPHSSLSNNMNLAINIQQLTAQCQQEIDEMKRENISIDDDTDSITFDDLLKKHDHFIRRFVDNEDIQTTLKQLIYDKKYPLYIDIVRSRFQNVKYRYQVINSAKEHFYKYICQKMPAECIEMVFSYLSVGELKRFIDAMKPLNSQSYKFIKR